jgi:spectinomycin phosphotransferase/16S rRNA (guanine(1405)-N(7))-methyltransferase
MLNPPAAFSEEDLCALLANRWGLQVTGLAYVPVGFGSHHWSVRDAGGAQWFVNVDELEGFPLATDDPLRSLRNALSVPRALVDEGHALTVAPERAGDGGILAELGDGYAVSVYPHVEGESFEWQQWKDADPALAAEAMRVVTELHRVPESAWGTAEVEGFLIPRRGMLEALLSDPALDPALGPFARQSSKLVARVGAELSALLVHYDRAADAALDLQDRFVLTHGEPHLGNYLRGAGRLLLIDWDSALIGPPERDLWSFGVGDPSLCELYQLRWHLSETAAYLGRFSAPHTGAADERASWVNLVDTVVALETTAARI